MSSRIGAAAILTAIFAGCPGFAMAQGFPAPGAPDVFFEKFDLAPLPADGEPPKIIVQNLNLPDARWFKDLRTPDVLYDKLHQEGMQLEPVYRQWYDRLPQGHVENPDRSFLDRLANSGSEGRAVVLLNGYDRHMAFFCVYYSATKKRADGAPLPVTADWATVEPGAELLLCFTLADEIYLHGQSVGGAPPIVHEGRDRSTKSGLGLQRVRRDSNQDPIWRLKVGPTP